MKGTYRLCFVLCEDFDFLIDPEGCDDETWSGEVGPDESMLLVGELLKLEVEEFPLYGVQ